MSDEQEIVWRVEGLVALAGQLEVQSAKASGQVEELTPSLLARAVRGQVVPRDPDNEPAVKLVEQIRARSEIMPD